MAEAAGQMAVAQKMVDFNSGDNRNRRDDDIRWRFFVQKR